MQLVKHCPCCGENIKFKTMFKIWIAASEKEGKTIHCFFCSEPIGKRTDYARYGLMGALPLFAVPLVYDSAITAYMMAGVIGVYTLGLFGLLYMAVPLRCMDTNEIKTAEAKNSEEDAKNDLVAVVIVSVVFFISIFALFAPLFSK